MKSLQQIRRECATLKRTSRDLADMVDRFVVAMDAAMKMPEGRSRGMQIGRLVGALELTLHRHQHFGLGMSFDAMKRRRARKNGGAA